MSRPSDHPQTILSDLVTWLRQHESSLPSWYLDEGPVAGLPLATDSEAITAAAAVPAATTAPTPAPASPAATGPRDADPEFQVACEQFVNDTLVFIERHGTGRDGGLEPDSLLVDHGGDKAAALAALRDQVLPCTACPLHERRKNTVFGAGNPDAEVILVGEAPGADEDRQGEPFVGKSGQLLTKILAAIGYAREDVFICNILKCRPPNNRDPQATEVEKCEPHLRRQLAILRPRVICCLGRVAAQTLLGTDTSLKRLRAAVHFYAGVPVMATYHPAALLRNPGWKHDTWDDVRKLRALVEALRAREI